MENQLFINVIGLLVKQNIGFVHQDNGIDFDYRATFDIESIYAVGSEVYLFFKDKQSVLLDDLEQIRAYSPFKIS